MALSLDTELSLVVFRESDGKWTAFIHDFVGLSLQPTATGDTPEAARNDLYAMVGDFRPALDEVEQVKVSLRVAIRHTLLSAKPSTQTESLSLRELYRRSEKRL
jgi:hypothetical protein